MSAKEVILNISNMTKIYGRQFNILRRIIGNTITGAQNVSFKVRRGEIFGFLGPNGAGKTTVIRSILDYLRIQEGEITVFGLHHHKQALDIRKRIGYVPGDLSLYGGFTGEELIDYFDKFRPVNRDFLDYLRQKFHVDLSRKIKTLSKGNRQQVGLIIALAPKPEFLILDEPTIGLDPLMTTNFHKILKKLKKEGHTIFLSSHDLMEVQAICDKVGIIKKGEIILIEEIEDLKTKFLQNVRISFDPSSIPAIDDFKGIPSIITIEKENKNTYRLKIKEDINEFLKILTKHRIKRITIEDATLEEIFLQYYE